MGGAGGLEPGGPADPTSVHPAPHLLHQPRVIAVSMPLGVQVASLNPPLVLLLIKALVVAVVASVQPTDVAVPLR